MPVIAVTDLRRRYGAQVAVDGISFAVSEGEIFGILGPNGAAVGEAFRRGLVT